MAPRFPFRRRKVKDVGDTENLTEIAKNLAEIKVESPDDRAKVDFPDLVSASFIDTGAFSKLRELSADRETQYAAYDAMVNGDIIISSALEMYADDASQYDNLGRLIWCESDDESLTEYVNDLLDTLEIPKKLWSIYYALAEYGDVYLRLFKQEEPIPDELMPGKPALNEEMELDFSVPYENYVEVCHNPECIYDLVKKGKTCQYAYINKEAGRRKQDRIELYPPDQFVHIYIENPHIRDNEIFEFTTRENNDFDTKRHIYEVRRGKSMLHDIYPVEKEIQLMEDALLLGRFSKSAITRLFNVEVGDMPNTEVNKILRRIKSAFESKLSINANARAVDTYVQSSGLDNVVVTPVRNGQGSISVESIGGDVEDTRSLLDLDYFNDKRFGGLKIPKAFLGFEEALGSNSGDTLTRLDIRYGRTVKRLQTCVVQGMTDLVNLFLLHSDKQDSVNNFTIRVVTPITTDDMDRDELLQNKLSMVETIMSSVDLMGENRVDKVQLYKDLINYYVNDSRIFIGFEKYIKDYDPSQDDSSDDDSDDDFGW